jgi:hypothetical protein
LTWISVTGTRLGRPSRRSQDVYIKVRKNPWNGREVTTILRSHFTDAMPYQPATMARTG